MNELALFSGAGGGILGGHLLGWRTICAVEWDAYAAGVLIARQNDGVLPPFPIWDDVCTFDGRPWKGRVDVVSGGFPCQDISSAGKGAGIEGKRSGMWFQMARVIREVGPRYVFVENSPLLTKRGLNRVLGDLAAMGYDARWGVLGAVDAGAPHKRDRIWIVAHADSVRELQPEGSKFDLGGRIGDGSADVADAENPERRSGQFSKQNPSVRPQGHDKSFGGGENVANHNVSQLKGGGIPSGVHAKHANPNQSSSWWETDPADVAQSGMGRVVNGLQHRLHRIKCLGNSVVPCQAREAFRRLMGLK